MDSRLSFTQISDSIGIPLDFQSGLFLLSMQSDHCVQGNQIEKKQQPGTGIDIDKKKTRLKNKTTDIKTP